MKLLKQLIMVLDENGVQVNKLNIDEGVNGEYGIEVNREITIVDRNGIYSLYTTEGKLSATNYDSLTEALEVLADYLNRVKEGTILKSGNGKYTYRVIKHQTHDKYNLLDLETNRLLFLEHASLSLIQAQVREGVFCMEEEAETASTDIQVGDRVRVLNSKHGAEGEATVTAVLEDGDVELAGTNKRGRYLKNWSNHVSSLEKIEEEDSPMGYTFWYIDGVHTRNHHVLEASPEGYFEDSTGTRYTYQAVHGLVKPLDNEYARKAFERARHNGKLLKYYPVVDAFQTSY
ncbi:hypothetical protein [Staphylococcus virus vB_SurM-PSU2]|nr:hypothetical protein [Staphylococcus virus vB_SurM-PSU2]